MCCCEVKPAKSLKSWGQSHLNVGFVVGFLLLVTYLVVSQQLAISAPNVVTDAQRITDIQQIKAPGETVKGQVVCNTEGPFSDTCEVDGHVHTNGTALSVAVVSTRLPKRREWRIRPYSRRTVSGVKEVTITQLPGQAAVPPCTVNHSVPAVLFALGGYTGNYWHDFGDVLVPLFVASRRYGGEVQFLITNNNPRWLAKYQTLLRRLSRYDAVDLDADAQVRCFPHVTVGLRMHKEFTIVPEWAPGGHRLSMADFTRLLREAYALPRGAPVNLTGEPEKKPRLLLIHRGHYRRFVNERELVRAAEAVGFEVAVMEPKGDARVDEQARVVNSFDVLLGLHGAGLTNAVFLPAGAVVIQVVPYGKLEPMARREFGEPATDMGLKYLDYSVTAEESTLLDILGPDHPVIRDPDSVHRSGWDKVAEFYLGKQDVRINVTRLALTLARALDHLRQR
uniref:Glycosyltransferase 61 catalytic domain-containing protein n=1 Tax=Arundo donax TaxID=35708 RepID=A0A0A9CST2_ARUDO